MGGTVTPHESRNGRRTLNKLIQLVRCQPSRISSALQTSSDRSKTIGGALTLRKGWTLRRTPPTPTSVLPIQLFSFSMECRNSPSRRRTVDRHLCTEWRDPTNERQWEKKSRGEVDSERTCGGKSAGSCLAYIILWKRSSSLALAVARVV